MASKPRIVITFDFPDSWWDDDLFECTDEQLLEFVKEDWVSMLEDSTWSVVRPENVEETSGE